MDNYIDGFVHPIPREKLENYLRLLNQVAEIWKEHGALDYREYLGDDLSLEGTLSFPGLVSAKADDAVLFGWVTFESRDAREKINDKVATDPRMTELMTEFDTGFDPSRMAYGGFQSFFPA